MNFLPTTKFKNNMARYGKSCVLGSGPMALAQFNSEARPPS